MTNVSRIFLVSDYYRSLTPDHNPVLQIEQKAADGSEDPGIEVGGDFVDDLIDQIPGS